MRALQAMPGEGVALGAMGAAIKASSVEASVAATAQRAAQGDHIVLGLEAFGLEKTAADVGGRTLMNDVGWRSTFQAALQDSTTQITVSLDGVSGGSAYSQFMNAAQQGAASQSGNFNWEMSQLYQAGRHVEATFIRDGALVPNPFK